MQGTAQRFPVVDVMLTSLSTPRSEAIKGMADDISECSEKASSFPELGNCEALTGLLYSVRMDALAVVWVSCVQLESRLTNHILSAGGAATVNIIEYASTCT